MFRYSPSPLGSLRAVGGMTDVRWLPNQHSLENRLRQSSCTWNDKRRTEKKRKGKRKGYNWSVLSSNSKVWVPSIKISLSEIWCYTHSPDSTWTLTFHLSFTIPEDGLWALFFSKVAFKRYLLQTLRWHKSYDTILVAYRIGSFQFKRANPDNMLLYFNPYNNCV